MRLLLKVITSSFDYFRHPLKIASVNFLKNSVIQMNGYVVFPVELSFVKVNLMVHIYAWIMFMHEIK